MRLSPKSWRPGKPNVCFTLCFRRPEKPNVDFPQCFPKPEKPNEGFTLCFGYPENPNVDFTLCFRRSEKPNVGFTLCFRRSEKPNVGFTLCFRRSEKPNLGFPLIFLRKWTIWGHMGDLGRRGQISRKRQGAKSLIKSFVKCCAKHDFRPREGQGPFSRSREVNSQRRRQINLKHVLP